MSISGILMAATQGLGIRFMVKKFGERRSSLICQVIAMVCHARCRIAYFIRFLHFQWDWELT